MNTHWTDKQHWCLDRKADYKITHRSMNEALAYISHKPVGLWYDFDQAWGLHERNVGNPEYEFGYELEIVRDSGRLLTLNGTNEGLEGIYEFREKYSALMRGVETFPLNLRDMFRVINWKLVQEDYGGIEIYPYIKFIYKSNFRAELCDLWYTAWDLASGCVWQLDLIKSYKKIERLK